jgi:hypothetical protein
VRFFGIVERVVFEPSNQMRERVQIWGAFMMIESIDGTPSEAKRGYLYFKVPPSQEGQSRRQDVILQEWDDLRHIAGTGQAVAFGGWAYFGSFTRAATRGEIEIPFDGQIMRIRNASESPENPDIYRTEGSVVRLPPAGTLENIVTKLRQALK